MGAAGRTGCGKRSPRCRYEVASAHLLTLLRGMACVPNPPACFCAAVCRSQGLACPLVAVGSVLLQSPGLVMPAYLESAPPPRQQPRQDSTPGSCAPGKGEEALPEGSGLGARLWAKEQEA